MLDFLCPKLTLLILNLCLETEDPCLNLAIIAFLIWTLQVRVPGRNPLAYQTTHCGVREAVFAASSAGFRGNRGVNPSE